MDAVDTKEVIKDLLVIIPVSPRISSLYLYDIFITIWGKIKDKLSDQWNIFIKKLILNILKAKGVDKLTFIIITCQIFYTRIKNSQGDKCCAIKSK